ncbi:uncharacterized protein LOC124887139 [Capsicum annuum]|uniref:uncharacterized protein LOC124887139 n=1 Tax=Capsicum annuum TaxID=4072 RepID=UPI001FB0CD28|nr:uncharacterized protein LOC124887139 [Capsicum annuum]
MALKSPKEIWNYPKEEYTGDETIRGMKVLNLIKKFELQKMKDSETVKEYSDRLLSIVNKIGLLGTKFKDSRIVEKNLVTVPERYEVSIITLENTKDLSKITSAELLNTLQAPDAECKICNELGHEAVICKNKSQKYEAEAQVTKEEEEEYHLFVATSSTKKSDFWMIDNEGKGNIAIKTVSGTKIISNIFYVPDIDKSLLSVGQEEGFKLLFGDNYCRIFDSINLENLQIDMRSKGFLFNLREGAHKSWKNKDKLADLFKRSNSAKAETISDPRRNVEDMSQK